MHPNLALGIAAERRADMRRDAAAYRAARDLSRRSVSARTEPAAHRSPPHDGGADYGAAHLAASAEKMLVLPDGTTETAESPGLCSAGR
jgi:hypothetical protein